jgi:hypothetical protein
MIRVIEPWDLLVGELSEYDALRISISAAIARI